MAVEVEGFLREGGARQAMPFTQQQGARPQRRKRPGRFWKRKLVGWLEPL